MSNKDKPRTTRKKTAGGSPLLPLPVALLLAIAGAAMIVLSFPTFDIFPLGWLGPACLVLAIWGRGFGAAFGIGLLTGFLTNLGGFYWISNMLQDFAQMPVWLSWVLTCLLVMVQGLVYAFGAGISAGIIKKFPALPWILVFPIVYTAVEFVFPMIFPWYIANGQQKFTAIIQIADITGAAGITFLVVLVSTAMASILASRISKTSFPIIGTIVAVVAFGATIAYGVIRIGEIDRRVADAPKFKIGIVEANVGIWEKEAQNPDGSPLDGAAQLAMLYSNLLKHQYLSRDIEKEHSPDLIVWPESSYFPVYRVMTRRTLDRALAVSTGGSLFHVGEDTATPEKDIDISLFRETGLTSIAALGEKAVLAAGPAGAIYSFDGTRWTREKTDTDRDLTAVAWGRNGTDAVAVGENGVVLFRSHPARDTDGKLPPATWNTVETKRFETLRGVVDSERFGWVACGDGGVLFGFDSEGRVINLVPEGLPDLTSIDWSPASGIVAAGHQGAIVRVRGLNEVTIENIGNKALRDVDAGQTVWAVGDDGTAVACSDKCRTVKTGIRRRLNAVISTGPDRALAAGDDGVVLELDGRDGGKSRQLEGGRGQIAGLTDIPFSDTYPFPLDMKSVYVSRMPLPPEGSWQNAQDGFAADRKTPAQDRNAAVRGFSTPVIFGAASMEADPPEGREPIKHNTAVMLDSDGDVNGMYFKNKLLVFGEYLPMEKWFPFLREWLPEAGDWTPGNGPKVFELDNARIGISICYEGLLASFNRKLAHLNPNVLVNITNDAWFGKTHEPWLHLQLAELRTVETRMFMARSTNTGISAFTDPVGRRLSHTSLEDTEFLIGEVALTGEQTIYVRFGDVFAIACCGIALIMAGAGLVSRKKR
ncbi:MAG TPA: apolipoprotein N-acyltransferase [Myxococcota bacterium]|nr:apolipoprotein N-acyltransferase [Myxococcota bacterium]